MTPIATLVLSRTAELGWTRGTLVQQLGWRSIPGGLRAVARLDMGEIHPLIEANAAHALGCAPAEVADAVRATRRAVGDAARRRRLAERDTYRAAFRPFVLALGERFPRPVCNLAHVFGDTAWNPAKLPAPAGDDGMPALIERHLRRTGGEIPVWGRIIGYALVHSPGRATRFTTSGRPVGEMEVPYV